jgi:hypothetical protein
VGVALLEEGKVVLASGNDGRTRDRRVLQDEATRDADRQLIAPSSAYNLPVRLFGFSALTGSRRSLALARGCSQTELPCSPRFRQYLDMAPGGPERSHRTISMRW